MRLAVIGAAGVMVVLFQTQWDRWVGLPVRQLTDHAYVPAATSRRLASRLKARCARLGQCGKRRPAAAGEGGVEAVRPD